MNLEPFTVALATAGVSGGARFSGRFRQARVRSGRRLPAASLRAMLPALLLAMLCTASPAADPPSYRLRSTWHDTLLDAREACVGRNPSFQAYAGPVVRGGEPARKIRVSVAGVKDLYLYVTGVPHPVRGAATWADAVLVTAAGAKQPVSTMPGLQVIDGQHAVNVNLKSGVSGPLKIAGRTFDRGLHVYADSKVRLPLAGKYAWFEAWIGIDDWVGKGGAVRFDVVDASGAARLDLWALLERDFPDERPRREIRWQREDRIWDDDWKPGDAAALAGRYAAACGRAAALAESAVALTLANNVRTRADLASVRDAYHRSRKLDESVARARGLDFTALRLAVDDLTSTFASKYPRGEAFAARIDRLQKETAVALAAENRRDVSTLEAIARCAEAFEALQREALLANPLLDFDRLLLIRREPRGDPRRAHGSGYGLGEYLGLPRQSSKCNPGIDEPSNWDNEIAVLSPVRPEGKVTTVYKPNGRRLLGDVDLHGSADRLLFSMPGTHDHWQVFEMGVAGGRPRQLTPGDQPDVHNYDACYLPDGGVAFISTAPLQGVPCNAGVIVGMMYRMDGDGRNIRQVCFEQDHDYCPTVLNDGRVLYLRWDYTDTPHVWNRVLFAMNPDGTGQGEYYGSNSYWPNAVFYARPIPNHPTKIAGIVTGHHVGRVGELVIFDPALGRHEADGVVQRIPGRGKKVEPLIEDKLTEHSWPKFLHPWPLSEKHFLVSCKPSPESLWGIYLVDTFDNMVLIKEMERQALLEPIPLKTRPKPPVIPDRTQPDRSDALVYLADVYEGPGLKGVPRGAIKSLRVLSYHFGYQKIAGIDHRIGTDGPWEVKRILGTVPVEADGSALFRVPAKTPLSVQPLDAGGKAVQLMRSWMTAMPGETLGCGGCHESRNATPAVKPTLALGKNPAEIRPWYGPARGFSFRGEVQPVLDRHCVGCHHGRPRDDGPTIADLRGEQNAYVVFRAGDPKPHVIRGVRVSELVGRYGGIFEPAYFTLRSFVRVPGLESDLHLLPPTEFHADTNELVQMLRKGHHGVTLDPEAWDRLITWIDLNAPCHGTWSEFVSISDDQRRRRCELRRLYGGIDEDGESPPKRPQTRWPPPQPAEPIVPRETVGPPTPPIRWTGWPLTPGEAQQRQREAAPVERTLDLGDGVALRLVRIPAGGFVMGDAAGSADEQPAGVVRIEKPFWIAACETTNRQFARFDPAHQSRYEHRGSWVFAEEYLGYPLDGPQQPVVRVSCDEALEFCRWVGQRTGHSASLPTEAQWEYACRAGADTPFSFGAIGSDFSPFANMADVTIRELAYRSWSPKTPDIVPRDERFNDRALVSAAVGSFRPNAWGLFDMHGNVAEWTRSSFRAYPYRDDGRNEANAAGLKVVRGGSWRDRPARCRSAFRLAYAPYQKVYNVGFRIVVQDGAARTVAGMPVAR